MYFLHYIYTEVNYYIIDHIITYQQVCKPLLSLLLSAILSLSILCVMYHVCQNVEKRVREMQFGLGATPRLLYRHEILHTPFVYIILPSRCYICVHLSFVAWVRITSSAAVCPSLRVTKTSHLQNCIYAHKKFPEALQ